ncbi:hypothetical protein ABZX88_34310 [Kitasatospora aureofaciens]|uniref:hypothetical protein n=1 Tax=Kitasatospora aureofaciens TaxID=1894 RepID=UPI0033A85348
MAPNRNESSVDRLRQQHEDQEMELLREHWRGAVARGVEMALAQTPATFAAGPSTIAERDLRPRRDARYSVLREGTGLPPAARDLAADCALSLAAVDEIRAGGTADMSEETICQYLGAVRRAAAALAATADELTLIAREPDRDGSTVTYKTLGEAMDGLHFTTVKERHGRLLDGRTHAWRPWLVRGTDREGLYGKGMHRKAGEPLPLGACPNCGSLNVGASITDPGGSMICQDCGAPVPLSAAEEELLRPTGTDADETSEGDAEAETTEPVPPLYWELLECGHTVFRQYPPMGTHSRCTALPGEHSGLQEIQRHGTAVPLHLPGEPAIGDVFPFAGGSGQVSCSTGSGAGGHWWWIGAGEDGRAGESEGGHPSAEDALKALGAFLREHRTS